MVQALLLQYRGGLTQSAIHVSHARGSKLLRSTSVLCFSFLRFEHNDNVGHVPQHAHTHMRRNKNIENNKKTYLRTLKRCVGWLVEMSRSQKAHLTESVSSQQLHA
eukprot:2589801-Amphidinium_carterae.1